MSKLIIKPVIHDEAELSRLQNVHNPKRKHKVGLKHGRCMYCHAILVEDLEILHCNSCGRDFDLPEEVKPSSPEIHIPELFLGLIPFLG